MGKFILGGISSSQLSTLVLDQKELVYDVDNNQIFYGDGTATGGLPLAGLTAINVSGGTTSNNLTNIVFSNLNGVTFGLNGSTLTASVNAGGAGVSQLNGSNGTLSLAVASSLSASTNGSTISFGLASNITTALQSAGAYLTTAMLSNQGSSAYFSGNTTGGTSSGTHNGTAVTFLMNGMLSGGMSGNSIVLSAPASTLFQYTSQMSNYQTTGNYLTTARASNDGVGLNTAATNVTWTVNSNGISLNNSAYLTTQTVQPVAFSASNGSAQFETLYFSNANGVTFSTDHIAGTDIIKASVKTDYAGTNTGATNASITVNTSGVSISVAAPVTTNGLISGAVVSAGGAFTTASNFSFGNANGVSWGINGSTITASVNAGGGGNTKSTFIPYYPASTGAQTLGAQGTSSASAWVFPISVEHAIAFNELRLLQTLSFISSTVSGQQSITSNFGLFSQNGSTLSRISSGSLSMAMTVSSVSATLSFPTATGTGGYTYGTVTASTTAQAQSLFGTAGNRIVGLQFGNSMSLSEGLYWIGVHQRQSSSSANVGIGVALAGNVMAAAQNAGLIGSSTAAFTGGTNAEKYKFAWGIYTSTGSAGYSGTNLPSSMLLSAINNSVTIMPMMTFIST